MIWRGNAYSIACNCHSALGGSAAPLFWTEPCQVNQHAVKAQEKGGGIACRLGFCIDWLIDRCLQPGKTLYIGDPYLKGATAPLPVVAEHCSGCTKYRPMTIFGYDS